MGSLVRGVAVTIGGVRTNFRMPDVISIGLEVVQDRKTTG